jgi:hypothetical protein
MKTVRFLSSIVLLSLAFLFVTSCESNPEVESQEDLLPAQFRVDIPASISSADGASGGRLRTYGTGRKNGDSVKGNDIYKHLGTFIAVGKGASQLVEEFIHGIRKHHINRVMSMTFVGEDDERVKNLVVSSQVEFEGKTWDYQLTITDADSEAAADGGKALQIFWNKNAKVTGIAIIKPYNCDRPKNANAPDAIFRIDYSEDGSLGYDAHMEVRISGFPVGDAVTEPFSMSTLHMFAGRKGNVVDVFGNSNHPNAILFSGQQGFNWAFVASADKIEDIGVAEVGLPPSSLDSEDREVLLTEYSVMNVFTNEISAAWPGVDPSLLAAYLSETAAPGYFENAGFISGGASPGEPWDELAARLEDLTPYNPVETSNLSLSFK